MAATKSRMVGQEAVVFRGAARRGLPARVGAFAPDRAPTGVRAFLAGAFFEGVFFAGAFFAGAFLAGTRDFRATFLAPQSSSSR